MDQGPLGQNRTKEKQYAFDHAFDKKEHNTKIFKHTSRALVDGIL